MNTLRNTVRRLQELSVQPSPTTGSQEEQPARLAELVREIELLASEPLFLGRPLGQSGYQAEWPETNGTAPGTIPLEPSELVGVEILSGRFESTNDRLVGVYEEHRMRAAGLEWRSGFVKELLAGQTTTTQSTPILPFALGSARGRLYHMGMQFPEESAAHEAAEALHQQILARVSFSVGAQANTSERVVRMLTR